MKNLILSKKINFIKNNIMIINNIGIFTKKIELFYNNNENNKGTYYVIENYIIANNRICNLSIFKYYNEEFPTLKFYNVFKNQIKTIDKNNFSLIKNLPKHFNNLILLWNDNNKIINLDKVNEFYYTIDIWKNKQDIINKNNNFDKNKIKFEIKYNDIKINQDTEDLYFLSKFKKKISELFFKNIESIIETDGDEWRNDKHSLT